MERNESPIQGRAVALHHRLLAGDVTASSELFELLGDRLVARLKARWPRLAGTDALHDASVDALIGYLQAPDRYDPTRAALLSWLELAAHRDLANDHASPRRTFERAWLVESALSAELGTGEGPLLEERLAVRDVHPVEESSGVLSRIREAFPDAVDRELIFLYCIEGERSTKAAAEVLGIGGLPPGEQASEVKRHKDRILHKLRRMGLGEQGE
ncbi:hypothetical protein ACRYCC_43015 [Actinomadura scrupuli]|uniref:hypothetical protein n=1 Tax=Actinomadura scrupuli TaxID=559629 RepID=UPI003D956FA7